MKNRKKIRLCIIMIATILTSTLLLETISTVFAITNGQPDTGNDYPYVCLVVADIDGAPAYRGTGVLISPTVVLTAGHLTDGASGARVWFDPVVEGNPDYPGGGPSAIEGTPYTHPDYCLGCGPGLPSFLTHDVGIVVLEEPVTNIEPAQLPSEGFVDELGMMTDVDQVGYGVQYQVKGDHGPPYWVGEKIRYYAPAQFISSHDVFSDEFIKLTANPAKGKGGTSFGDSGGPILLGGTDIIVGLTSWGTNYNCKGISFASRIDTAVVLDWIQEF